MQWKQFVTPVANLDPDEARAFIGSHKEGTYTLLDVRQPGEYGKGRIPGAKLVPLPELGDRLGDLNPEEPIIAYCATGGRSRAAAQLLAGNGFKEVYNLKGGIRAWNGLKAEGPSETGMAYLRGDEDVDEIVVLAYGMEEGLRGFYEEVRKESSDPDVADLAGRLSEIEERHKERLFALYVSAHSTISLRETFESKVVRGIMEGGFTTQEFLSRNREAMTTVPDLLSIAMMLEAQALDLYMRYAEKVSREAGKGVLYDLAEEEKGHLNRLGALLEAKI